MARRLTYTIIYLIVNSLSLNILAQNETSISTASAITQAEKPKEVSKKPELFNSGVIDFQNTSQIAASARVFKLYLGEPGKISLPLALYSGVSGSGFNSGTTSTRTSEPLILNLINPTAGIFNIYTDNFIKLGKRDSGLTKLSVSILAGEKISTGYQAITYRSFNFFSSYFNPGLIFQTGAWEKMKEKNLGVFWIWFQVHFMRVSNSFQALSGYPPDRKSFKGYSLGTGIDINKVLNIKVFYYRYINPDHPSFDIPIYQLTFNYNSKI